MGMGTSADRRNAADTVAMACRNLDYRMLAALAHQALDRRAAGSVANAPPRAVRHQGRRRSALLWWSPSFGVLQVPITWRGSSPPKPPTHATPPGRDCAAHKFHEWRVRSW